MQERELVYAVAKLGKIVFCFMLEKLTQDEIGHEIGFIMGMENWVGMGAGRGG